MRCLHPLGRRLKVRLRLIVLKDRLAQLHGGAFLLGFQMESGVG